jgi:hypothetical protein
MFFKILLPKTIMQKRVPIRRLPLSQPQPYSLFHLTSSIIHLTSAIIPLPSHIFHHPSYISHHPSSIIPLPSSLSLLETGTVPYVQVNSLRV